MLSGAFSLQPQNPCGEHMAAITAWQDAWPYPVATILWHIAQPGPPCCVAGCQDGGSQQVEGATTNSMQYAMLMTSIVQCHAWCNACWMQTICIVGTPSMQPASAMQKINAWVVQPTSISQACNQVQIRSKAAAAG